MNKEDIMCTPIPRDWYYWTGAQALLDILNTFYSFKAITPEDTTKVIHYLDELVQYIRDNVSSFAEHEFKLDLDVDDCDSLVRVIMKAQPTTRHEQLYTYAQEIVDLLDQLIIEFSAEAVSPDALSFEAKERLFPFLEAVYEVESELDPRFEQLNTELALAAI